MEWWLVDLLIFGEHLSVETCQKYVIMLLV